MRAARDTSFGLLGKRHGCVIRQTVFVMQYCISDRFFPDARTSTSTTGGGSVPRMRINYRAGWMWLSLTEMIHRRAFLMPKPITAFVYQTVFCAATDPL